MKENMFIRKCALRWKQFSRKGYATFASLKKEVTIGVLTASTLIFASASSLSAQTDTLTQLKSYELEEIEVTGTRVLLTEAESVKMVTVLSRADIRSAGVQSVNDLLEYVAGVDIRQRGEFGIQTDISVRGGTFDQVVILLNGVNITNPQTGHHSAEFLVSLDDIERIEILEGAAARVFGASAFTGAIHIVTRNDKQSHLSAGILGGNYKLQGINGRANHTRNMLSNQISGNFIRSDGATKNSDFRIARSYYQGSYTSHQADVRWQLGIGKQAFGANTFYSPAYPDQFEELLRHFVSVQATTKGWLHLTPTVYWNRVQDHFQLIRHTATEENFHQVDVYGVNLSAYFNTILGKTAFGAEMRNEGILSTNLGKPLDEKQYVHIPGEKESMYTKKDNRTNMGYYIEHNILVKKATISVGVVANMNTALGRQFDFYPGVDISYRPIDQLKLYTSWNTALRMPTFTDMYYKSSTIQGNIGIRPEETQAVNLGAHYRNLTMDARISAFVCKGKNMIDWVMYSADDKYHSTNFELDNMGMESSVTFRFDRRNHINQLNMGYCYIYQKRHDKTEIYKSNYALEYLRHKFILRFNHLIWRELTANWAFRWQDRMGSYLNYDAADQQVEELTPYPSFSLLDLKILWTKEKYNIYVEVNNLLNRKYYDLGNIPQPGRWIKVGMSYRVNLR